MNKDIDFDYYLNSFVNICQFSVCVVIHFQTFPFSGYKIPVTSIQPMSCILGSVYNHYEVSSELFLLSVHTSLALPHKTEFRPTKALCPNKCSENQQHILLQNLNNISALTDN